MGVTKTYMIVTNDEFEHPVEIDIHGVKAAAKYLGITVQAARNRIHKDSWGKLPYKILVDQLAECIPFNEKEYGRRYRMTHDRSDYMREYYRRNKEKIRIVQNTYRERKR